MGLFNIFDKEKREKKRIKRQEMEIKDSNEKGTRKFDDLFNQFEKGATLLNTDLRALNLDDTEGIQQAFPINSMWSAIYKSAISSFIPLMEAMYQKGRITKLEYEQIKPLLDKCNLISEAPLVNQQQYNDFLSELRIFSENYPKYFDSGLPMTEFFLKNIWEPYFQKYYLWAEKILNKYESFLEKKRDKIQLMVTSNYAFISPYEFEELVAELFKKMGYDVTLTPKSGDYGVDVIARSGGDVIAIQAKKYSKGNNVGNRDVQRLLGAMHLSTIKANKGILITTSEFTVQAKEQAKEAPIELWHGEYFNSILFKYLGKNYKD